MSARKPAPRTILMTADGVGGVFVYAATLADALGARGYRVIIATMGQALRDDQRSTLRRIPNLRLYESSFRLEWEDEPWADVSRAGEWLLQIEDRERPDLVHVNGYAHGAAPFRAPALVVAHSCVLSWWSAVKRESAPERYRTYARAVRRGLDAAAAVVAPSSSMLEALLVHYGSLPNARVIHNGAYASTSAVSKEAYFFAAGRLWDPAKNVRAVVEAAKSLAWPVIIAGDREDPRGGRVELEGVRHLGRVSPTTALAWMDRARVFVAPARYEPFGLAILEAALRRCALVLGDIPSLREIWENDAAIFVDPEDPEALAAALRSLEGDPTRATELGAKARRRAVAYSVENMSERYMELYESMVSHRTGSIPCTS